MGSGYGIMGRQRVLIYKEKIMLKKVLPRILVFCLIFVITVPVFAATANDDGDDTYWPGVDFKSISEFEDYLSECHKTGNFDKIGEPYAAIGEIYIPKAFEKRQDTLIDLGAEFYNYYVILYRVGSTDYRFFHFYNNKSGQITYDLSKEYYNKRESQKEYMAQKNEVNGHTVYSYYVLGGTKYTWEQDGEYFSLEVNKKPNEKFLALCGVKKIPLNIKYTPQNLATVIRFRDSSAVTIGLQRSIKRTAITTPAGLKVTYYSSNPEVAKVDDAGQVKGLSAGNTTITATATLKGKSYKSSYNLTVSSISELHFGVENVVIKAGAKSRFTCSSLPRKQNVSYSSSDPAIASVNSNGEISALNPGTVTITGECFGLKASYNLHIIPKDGEYEIKDGYYYVSGNPAPMDILTANPETDYFRYKGSLCVNASGVEYNAVDKLALKPKGLAGKIESSGFSETRKDWGASELPVGTEVYFAAIKTKQGEATFGEILLVKLGNKYVPYLLGCEE